MSGRIVKKSFDSKTAKKIINEYAEKINILTRENLALKKQLEDAQTSLKLNKDILYSHLSQNLSKEAASIIQDLQKENNRLTEKITWLFTEKAETSKKIYLLQQEIDEKQRKENAQNEKEDNKKFVEKNQIIERDNKILYLQKQLEKATTKTSTSKTQIQTKVVYLGDPNKFNVEMNNELVTTRALIKKYSALLQREKLTTQKMANEMKDMESALKNSANPNLVRKKNEVNVMDCIFDDEDDENDDNVSDDEDLDDDDLDGEKENDVSFPDKIHRLKTVDNTGGIPKLDLSSVTLKYKKPDNLKITVKKSNRSNDEYVEKLKAQIKIFKSTINKYKEKLKKLREQNASLRNNLKLLQATIKSSNYSMPSNTNGYNESMNPQLSESSDPENNNKSTNTIVHEKTSNDNNHESKGEEENQLENLEIKE